MTPDVDLLRLLMLYLETRQTSPRATVLLDLQEEADELGLTRDVFAGALTILLERDYIEGPGAEGTTLWLFRKLSAKGVQFVRAASDPAAWEVIKQRFGPRGAGEA